MDHNLRFLGMAKKAALLAVGFEDTSKAMLLNKAQLVLSASDASEGSKRRARENSRHCGAIYAEVPYTMMELGTITGRGSPGTLAILEPGLAAGFLEGLAKTNPEMYEEMATQMSEKAKRQTIKRKAAAKDNLSARGGARYEYDV
jgi:ribosomal protein L7Ae-like RNA K-turn-binding protein